MCAFPLSKRILSKFPKTSDVLGIGLCFMKSLSSSKRILSQNIFRRESTRNRLCLKSFKRVRMQGCFCQLRRINYMFHKWVFKKQFYLTCKELKCEHFFVPNFIYFELYQSKVWSLSFQVWKTVKVILSGELNILQSISPATASCQNIEFKAKLQCKA